MTCLLPSGKASVGWARVRSTEPTPSLRKLRGASLSSRGEGTEVIEGGVASDGVKLPRRTKSKRQRNGFESIN
jgi:hypothetical protein